MKSPQCRTVTGTGLAEQVTPARRQEHAVACVSSPAARGSPPASHIQPDPTCRAAPEFLQYINDTDNR